MTASMNIPLCRREKNAFDVLPNGDFCKQVEHNLNVFIIVKAFGVFHAHKGHPSAVCRKLLISNKNIMNRQIINHTKCIVKKKKKEKKIIPFCNYLILRVARKGRRSIKCL